MAPEMIDCSMSRTAIADMVGENRLGNRERARLCSITSLLLDARRRLADRSAG
jgi:hypothetical protein